MKAFLFFMIAAAILMTAGCGSTSNVSSDDSGNRNYYDGYTTSETHSAQHVEMKDASSTAIYGIRGANGVIIVTSKAAQHAKEK